MNSRGANRGLTVAEVELKDAKEQVELPDWIDREVSDDPRYFNSNLSSQTLLHLEMIRRRSRCQEWNFSESR